MIPPLFKLIVRDECSYIKSKSKEQRATIFSRGKITTSSTTPIQYCLMNAFSELLWAYWAQVLNL